MNEYYRTRQAVEAIISEGTFPTPKLVLERLGLKSTRNDTRLGGQGLNSTKSRARRDALKAAGFAKDYSGRWYNDDVRSMLVSA